MKTESLKAIHEAQMSIGEAEMEGRAKGLSEARTLLQEAKDAYVSFLYIGPNGAIPIAGKAKEAANKAIKPSLVEAYILPATLSSTIIAVLIGGLIIKWRNGRRKDSKRAEKTPSAMLL